MHVATGWMFLSKTHYIAVLIAFLTINHDELRVLGNNRTTSANGIWWEAGKTTGLLLHGCLRLVSPEESPARLLIILRDCLKRKTLTACDRLLQRDVIELGEGVALVRFQRGNDTRYNRYVTIAFSATELFTEKSKINMEKQDWLSQISNKLLQLSRTHILKIHLKSLNGGFQFEGRGRHRKQNNMFSNLMMFGLVAAGLIVIPMGFQFLAILGGKALLLAKLALLLSSIQGLKKIATSNLNYGLYSAPYGQGQGPCKDCLNFDYEALDYGDVHFSVDFEDLAHRHYDRQWPHEDEGQGLPPITYTNYHNDLLHPRLD
ncbi:hypothetical protein NQ317_006661 [Molorchus minor]|uniref:Uncharacterized protein n=1 Tax=Molorchus minor TaxID=1323400 RepID=A0ABQ9JWW0_9CUCU|nr:hypothetical protein NQ317_006661 [Molorchus minor]